MLLFLDRIYRKMVQEISKLPDVIGKLNGTRLLLICFHHLHPWALVFADNFLPLVTSALSWSTANALCFSALFGLSLLQASLSPLNPRDTILVVLTLDSLWFFFTPAAGSSIVFPKMLSRKLEHLRILISIRKEYSQISLGNTSSRFLTADLLIC